MKLIAVDIDNTLTNETCWTHEQCVTATPNQKVIDKVNELYKTNCIIIYTARVPELRLATETWLKVFGVKYHALRMDKLPANLYLDDKAVNSLKALDECLDKGTKRVQ